MKYLKIILVFSMFFLQIRAISAQDDLEPVEIPFSDSFTLYSEEIDQEFVISVALPFSYFDSEATSFPVMYVLDPGVSFGTMVDIANLGALTNSLPEIIIVGIGYPFPTEERIRDYMQEPDVFLQFIENDLIPMIEESYRVNPYERAITGWSAGGYFALYALFNNPDVFNRYIVISPPIFSAPFATISIRELEEIFADNPMPLFDRVFLSGGIEPGGVEEWSNFANIVNSRNYTGLELATNFIDDAEHTTVLPMALALGMRDIYCRSVPSGCVTIAPFIVELIEDADFPIGLNFTTPDILMVLKTSPSRSATGAGQCRNMEATILAVVGTSIGEQWVQLDCGENVGWVQLSRLED